MVVTHGTPEETKAVELGRAPLRKTADKIRARRRALAPPAPPKPKSVTAQPAVDPIEALALDIVSKCSDGKWAVGSQDRVDRQGCELRNPGSVETLGRLRRATQERQRN